MSDVPFTKAEGVGAAKRKQLRGYTVIHHILKVCFSCTEFQIIIAKVVSSCYISSRVFDFKKFLKFLIELVS